MSQHSIVRGSVADLAQQRGVGLAESFLNVDKVILVDVSTSMEMHDASGGRSRYEAALTELAALQANLPGKVAVIAFSSSVQFVPGGAPPMLGGSTRLADALRFAKLVDAPDMRFVVISDGEPDSAEAALEAAAEYRGRIDTVFVGPEKGAGRDFLQRLANAKRGQAVTAAQASQLAAKLERLLITA